MNVFVADLTAVVVDFRSCAIEHIIDMLDLGGEQGHGAFGLDMTVVAKISLRVDRQGNLGLWDGCCVIIVCHWVDVVVKIIVCVEECRNVLEVDKDATFRIVEIDAGLPSGDLMTVLPEDANLFVGLIMHWEVVKILNELAHVFFPTVINGLVLAGDLIWINVISLSFFVISILIISLYCSLQCTLSSSASIVSYISSVV